MSLRNVKCWLKRVEIKQKLRRGRKINYDFELEVWNELVEFGVQDKMEGGKMCGTVVTVRTIVFVCNCSRAREKSSVHGEVEE